MDLFMSRLSRHTLAQTGRLCPIGHSAGGCELAVASHPGPLAAAPRLFDLFPFPFIASALG